MPCKKKYSYICKFRCDVCAVPTETVGSVGLAGQSLSPVRRSERPGLRNEGGDHELTLGPCAHRHRGVHTRHLYKHKSYRKHSKMLNTTVFDRQFLI